MSENPEIELDLDLQLLPAWARQPQTANRYANFDGPGEGDRGDRRGPRSRGPGGPRRDFGGRPDFRGPRPGGPGGPQRRDDRGPRGPRGPGGPGGPGGDRRHEGRRPEPVEDLPAGISVDLIPDPAGVDSLAKQIRQTGRAYPLFDIAHLILKRPDRYLLEFRAEGNESEGVPRQLWACNLDDSVWLQEAEAVRHVLTKHFATFYSTEKIAVDPPKGTYTFVAQCGMSGVVLGPPNLHDYQSKLQRLHRERFPRVPFDVFKSRVRIVRDEAVVKKWIEEQSFKFEYVCLNVPEPLKLNSQEAVEQHFRQVHLPNIIKPSTTHTVRTPAAREALPGPLRRLARREFDLQQRFPLKLVTRLSDDFAHRGLHFFKVNKTILHVAVARPRHLDLETSPVSDGVKRIVQTIQATPDCTRRKLLESLGFTLPAAETPAPGAPAPEQAPPSPELSAIIGDLHWLIHEGHVIEFATGRIELAKKPLPRPTPTPRPPRPPAKEASATPAAEAPAALGDSTAGQVDAPDTAAPASTPDTEPVSDSSPESAGAMAETAEVDTPASPAEPSTPPPASNPDSVQGEAASTPPADEDPNRINPS